MPRALCKTWTAAIPESNQTIRRDLSTPRQSFSLHVVTAADAGDHYQQAATNGDVTICCHHALDALRDPPRAPRAAIAPGSRFQQIYAHS